MRSASLLLTADQLVDAGLRLRFLALVKEDPTTGCHLWTGALDRDGYGRFNLSNPKRQRHAHRVAYALFVGPVPDGADVEHACHTRDESCDGTDCVHRRCVRPDHLEALGHRANVLRGRSFSAREARQTTCYRGHELSGDNLYSNAGRRYCRACRRLWARERRGEPS